MNDPLFAQLEMTEPESIFYAGAGGARVQMWIVRPPRFDTMRKYPLVFWVHGGPQGAFLNSWSYRWNAQLCAAQGYVLALPNPRGSTGFGQKFVDEISHDWGGKVARRRRCVGGKPPWLPGHALGPWSRRFLLCTL